MEFQSNKGKKEYCVGLDITDSFSQISIGSTDSEEVETLNASPNGGSYQIPTALFKRSEVNQWFVGKETLKYKDSDGYYIDRLVEKAKIGEDIQVGEEFFNPAALLALFIKRTLALVNTVTPLNNISCLMITVEEIDKKLIEVLTEAVASLGLKTKEIHFQSHQESFYNYMMIQPKELWNRDVFLFDSSGDNLKALRMECVKTTTPVVVTITETVCEDFGRNIYESEEASGRFAKFAENTVEGCMYSSVYLVGDEFKREWCREGANILCRKGRVFQGNNLFSKGAVYAGRNIINPSIIRSGYVYLDDDKLRVNVGLYVIDRGKNDCLYLLNGGTNWFEAKCEMDLIVNRENKLSFVITPLTGKNPVLREVSLGELPKRPKKATRIHLSIRMKSETEMIVNVKDLGFGELFPAADVEWSEVISV